jgi:two-component system, NarL family, sensor histidine kinase LiaS
MRRFLRSFRRLRWKLTASYTLVTVTTLVVLHLALLGVALVPLLLLGDQMPKYVVARLSRELAPQASPYLGAEPPDLDGLHRWLASASRSDIATAGSELTGLRLAMVDLADESTRLLVLDADGRVLGDSRRAAPAPAPLPLDASLVPGVEQVLPSALQGETEAGALYQLTEPAHLTFAVPVRADGGADGGAVVGALVLSGRVTPVAFAIGVGSAAFVAASALGLLVFSIAAGLMGGGLGFLTAQGLTRRLERVTAAAEGWGAGDFSPTIADRSADELGQLGRHLNRMAAQLADVVRARQQLATAEERNRLARDLHDSVKQQVFATGMHLAAARALWDQDPAAARRRLEAAAELVRLSQRELTDVIQALRPAPLEGQGLSRALAEHVVRWRGQTGIAAAFEARGGGPLPSPVEEALFRIAQEALSNIARHSGASETRVTLTAAGDEAVLAVEDNGRGLGARGARGAPRGEGLKSMRERVEAIGGDLRIESGARGTSVVARVPVDGGGEGEHE